jgi:threonine dehydratase
MAAGAAARVMAAETDAAPQLWAALQAGKPTSMVKRPSFIDGMGGLGVFPIMWWLVRQVADGSIVVSVDEVAEAVRLLVRHNSVVAEGAGGGALAAAISAPPPDALRIACVVSGGNIDPGMLATLLGRTTT